jgi:hypothetical protein
VHNEEVSRSPSLGKQKQGVLAVATTGLFSKSMPLIDARLRGFIVTANQGKTAHASRRTTQARTLRFRVGRSPSIHLPLSFP